MVALARLSVCLALGRYRSRDRWCQSWHLARLGNFSVTQCIKHLEHFAPGREGPAIVAFVLVHRLHEDDFLVTVIALAGRGIDLPTPLAKLSSLNPATSLDCNRNLFFAPVHARTPVPGAAIGYEDVRRALFFAHAHGDTSNWEAVLANLGTVAGHTGGKSWPSLLYGQHISLRMGSIAYTSRHTNFPAANEPTEPNLSKMTPGEVRQGPQQRDKMTTDVRYYAAACQTNLPNPRTHAGIAEHVDRMLAMIDRAVLGYAPFFAVKLVVFPEFGHAAPIYQTVAELTDRLVVPIPNEHTDRYHLKARQHGIYIQTGTFLECDDRYPGHVFNTTCLIGPDGLLSRYRKVHTWIPWEVHASPHDLSGYGDDLFPVTDTEIGKLGVAICYDWLFPEAIRQLALGGAEVLIRVSAYMDPWGATAPMDWWTIVNRCRALENLAYVVAANQGAEAENYPPFSWPGGSMIVDYDGRILAQADPGPGDKIVVGPIDLAVLRAERERRRGHHMLSHLRMEAYPHYRRSIYPGSLAPGKQELSLEENERAIGEGKARLREKDTQN